MFPDFWSAFKKTKTTQKISYFHSW